MAATMQLCLNLRQILPILKQIFFKGATTVNAIIHQFFSIMMPFTRKKNKTHGLTYINRIKIDIIIPTKIIN